ncbi:zinc finger protein [Macleaya cordata]|uniref:Zinc finger protein n=1 Tax=Macleaya cordata TaxID=56857 RepID=A0A200PQH4_MACCD|nr:zinc finger protein [Macleaya cordata]
MEDEIQKRNTDCVYFLASPLTCKKGIECEYRHSEVARLNPRDCYYWLAGNCLNPTCAFRHPPLDGRPETSSEPAALPQQSSLPVNKVHVPCYFYFNGFCNKGDRCSFLHGPNDVSPTPKVPKTTPTVNDARPLENKTSTGSDTLTTVVEAPSNPPRTSKSVVNVQFKPQEDVQQSVPSNAVERSPSLQTSVPDCEEEAVKSDTPLPAEDFIGQSLSSEQSSEEQVEEEHIEREEWWESSPGLDVLVDNGSEGYEDDQEYLPIHDAEIRRLHDHLLQYDYEDPVGYDPMEYTGAGVLYEDGVYDMYNGLDDEDISDYCRVVPKPSMDRNLDPRIFQKRKFLPRELEVNGRNGMDLRDHLRKRKRIDGHQPSRNPRKRGPSFLEEKNQERPKRHHMGHPHRRRLASEVGHNMIGFDREKDRELNGVNRRSSLRQSESRRNRSRQHEKDKRRQFRSHLPSEVSAKDPISREMRGGQDSTTTLFTGPKTLAQIREEKRKARENGETFGNTRRRSSKIMTSKDFEGPKPLSEILKDKRRLGSVSDDGSSTRSKQEDHRHVECERGNHEYFGRDRIGLMIDEDEDDDEGGLEKKLASIYA